MADEHKIFQLRYIGARFAGARLPLDVLSDLPAFRDLLISYAKKRWRGFNANRQRIPKGFDKSISLDLIAIDKGSAVLKLDWSRQDAQTALPGFTDELEVIVDRSFNDLVMLIDGAGHHSFPQTLSSDHIRALNKLGSGLLEKEKIEFLGSQGKDGNVVYLDTVRRKSLITQLRDKYQKRFEGIGRYSGGNESGYIFIDTDEFKQIKINIEPDRVKKEFDGNMGASVQYALQIELNNNDEFCNIIEVFNVELIDTDLSDDISRCLERLNELQQLQHGWLEGDGEAPSITSVMRAREFLTKRPSFAGQYRIFPTPVGGVLIEVVVQGWDLSVEFVKDGKVEMYGIEINGPNEMESESFAALGDDFLKLFDKCTSR